MIIPNDAKTIIQTIINNGFEAYLVGGCVRDSIMGIKPHDWDICTNALPTQIEDIFGAYTVIETGLKHGTVTVMMNHEPYEITTYRADIESSDCRQPDKAEFVRSLKKDLARRDFTMNSLAMDINGDIIDFFKGKRDILNKVIRCTGESRKRLSEDPLRVLRALRFASVLGFNIEHETASNLQEQAYMLEYISKERIQSEFSKILTGQNAYRVLTEYKDVIATVIPEIIPMINCEQNNPYHKYNVYIHSIVSMEYIESELELKLAMFFHDIGKPETKETDNNYIDHFNGHSLISAEITEIVLKRLKYPNNLIKRVVTLVKYHDTLMSSINKTTVKRLMQKVQDDEFDQLIKIRYADIAGQSDYNKAEKLESIKRIEQIAAEIKKQNNCLNIKDLKISGDSVVFLVGGSGPKVGMVLSTLLNEVVEETIVNEEDALIKRAAEIAKNL